jgi:hypothetical protein
MKKIFCLIGLLMFTGCGPVKVEMLETVDTNEEAFLVPLESDGTQGHVGGLQTMQEQANKVTTTRVSIAQRATPTGYMPWSYKFVPTEKLLKVATSPVNREWNSRDGKNAIEVESADSIELQMAATVTCSIARGEGAKFRYYFSGQNLEQVIDTEIHGYFQAKSAEEFGLLELENINSSMDKVGLNVLNKAREYFAPRGISIEFFGWIGGVRYANPVIQEKIDQLFVAENDALVAIQEQEVAKKNNAILVSKADAQKNAAITAFEAREATLLRASLEIQRLEAETIQALADKFDGTLPRLLPAGSGLLFGIDRPYKGSLPDAAKK